VQASVLAQVAAAAMREITPSMECKIGHDVLVQHTPQGPCVMYRQYKSYFTDEAILSKPDQPCSRVCHDPALQPLCHPSGNAAVADATERLRLVKKAHCDACCKALHEARVALVMQHNFKAETDDECPDEAQLRKLGLQDQLASDFRVPRARRR
jgi:hypothetical protein